MAIARKLIMPKKLGKPQPVRGKLTRKSALKSGKTKRNVSSKPLVRRKQRESGKTKRSVSSKPLIRRNKRAYVPSAAAFPEEPTTPIEANTIISLACALVLLEHQASVPSAASADVPEDSSTPTEENPITLPACALVLLEHQASVPSVTSADVPEEPTTATEANTIISPACALVLLEHQDSVPSAASADVPEGSTTPTEENPITLSSRALVLWEHQAYLHSAAAAVPEEPTTPIEENTTTLVLRALVLRKNQGYVPSAAPAAYTQGWASSLGKYWRRETIDKENVLTIMMLPVVAWHTYHTHLQQRRTAMQMLVRGGVVRPADVDLHYITSVRKLGIGGEAQNSQPFRDLELTFCPEPLAAEMRARGKQLLQWLRRELAAKYLPQLRKAVEAGNRWCKLSGDQTHQAKDRQDQDARSSPMIWIIKTLGDKIGAKSGVVHQDHSSLNASSGYHGEVETIGLTGTGNPKSPSTRRESVAPHAGDETT